MMQGLMPQEKYVLSKNGPPYKLAVDPSQNHGLNLFKVQKPSVLEAPVLKYCSSSHAVYAEVNIADRSFDSNECCQLRLGGESGLCKPINAPALPPQTRTASLNLVKSAKQSPNVIQPSVADVYAYDSVVRSSDFTSKMQFEKGIFATTKTDSTSIPAPTRINGMIGRKLNQSPRFQSVHPSSLVRPEYYSKWPITLTKTYSSPSKSEAHFSSGRPHATDPQPKKDLAPKMQYISQNAVCPDGANIFSYQSDISNGNALTSTSRKENGLVLNPDQLLQAVVSSSSSSSSADKRLGLSENHAPLSGSAEISAMHSNATCDKATSTTGTSLSTVNASTEISKNVKAKLTSKATRGGSELRSFREARRTSLSTHNLHATNHVNSIPSQSSRVVLDDSFVVLNSSVSPLNGQRQTSSRNSSAKPRRTFARVNVDSNRLAKDSVLQAQHINSCAKKYRNTKSAKSKKLKSAKPAPKSSLNSQAGDVLARAASKLEKICLNSQFGDSSQETAYVKHSVPLSKENSAVSAKHTIPSRLCGDGADDREVDEHWTEEDYERDRSFRMLNLKRLPGDGQEHPANPATSAGYDVDYDENDSGGEDPEEDKPEGVVDADQFPDDLSILKDYGGEDVVLESDSNDNGSFVDPEAGADDDDTLSEGASEFSLSTCTTPVTHNGSEGDGVPIRPPLIKSLFSNCPPVVNFVTKNEKVAALPDEQRKLLKWKVCSITPVVVRHTVQRSGFKPSKKGHDWLGCFGKHLKAHGFRSLREYQKINHFPGSFQLGRKDRLWRNISKMQSRFGKKEFGFVPQTYVLPWDRKLLKTAWEEGNSKQKYILKPPASARGIGIHVIHKWSQVPIKRSVLVQKYISRPYLINGGKFDIRLYVHVTSFDPLRIYLFEDGLVRFATCKYSSSMKHLGNKYMHLTNYSINKKSGDFQQNEDASVCQGHKWSVKALWGYLKEEGVNTDKIWDLMKDIIIKTIISVDQFTNSLIKSNCRRQYCCHELFGFDIMLDDRLRPWVLEVNISPSLHSNSALDVQIKGPMVKDMFNLAGFVLPDKRTVQANAPAPSSNGSTAASASSSFSHDKRKQSQEMSPDSRAKHTYFAQHYKHADEQELMSVLLSALTVNDIQVLVESEDEFARKGQFQRIFPSTNKKYLNFFDQARYYNMLLYAWEIKYQHNRTRAWSILESCCRKGLHLPYSQMDPNNIPQENVWNLASFASSKLLPSPRTDTRLLPVVMKTTSIHSPYVTSVYPELTPPKSSVKRAQSASRLDPRFSHPRDSPGVLHSPSRPMRPLALLSPVRVHASPNSN